MSAQSTGRVPHAPATLEAPPPTTLVMGRPARMIAASQGHVWAGIADAGEITAAAEIGDHIDTRGDVLLASLRHDLNQIAASSKAAGDRVTHSIAVGAVAKAAAVAELDEHEDWHRARTRQLAGRQAASLGASSRIHEHLLTGRMR